VLAGESRVTVLRGDAGVGKSALLAYLSGRVAGWRVATAAGVESEMELAYSGLHQLCAPILDHIDRLPGPQRDALATVFGLSAGPAPDRFLVGLAVLSLFAEAPAASAAGDVGWVRCRTPCTQPGRSSGGGRGCCVPCHTASWCAGRRGGQRSARRASQRQRRAWS